MMRNPEHAAQPTEGKQESAPTLAGFPQFPVDPSQDGFWDAESEIWPLVSALLTTPLDDTWLRVKDFSNRLLTQRPEFRHLNHGVVLFIGKISSLDGCRPAGGKDPAHGLNRLPLEVWQARHSQPIEIR